MNYSDSKGITYKLFDLTCDNSVQNQFKQVVDGCVANLLDDSGQIDNNQLIYKLIDLLSDLSVQKEYKGVIDSLGDSIGSLSREDIGELASTGLALMRDITAYEGVRDLLYHVVDMVCDISVSEDGRELVGVLLERVAELPEYEEIWENIKLVLEAAQDLIRDLPTYEGAVEIIYELSNTAKGLSFYDSSLQMLNGLMPNLLGSFGIAGDSLGKSARDGI